MLNTISIAQTEGAYAKYQGENALRTLSKTAYLDRGGRLLLRITARDVHAIIRKGEKENYRYA